MAQNSRRTPEGKPWPKGKSGNPGGRPKGLGGAVRALAGDDGHKLIEGLFALAFGTDKQMEAVFGKALKPAVKDRRECIKELLDRGFGRAVQAVEHSGTDGAALAFTLKLDAVDRDV